MFRGSAPAKIDDKGRLKIPTDFRGHLEERFGLDVFVTSIHGDSALVYPLAVWEELEARLAAMPSTHQATQRFLQQVNYFGQQTRLDDQGRLVMPKILRDKAEIVGEVMVAGHLNHLVVWNRERLESRLQAAPLTEDDFKALAELGI